MSSCHYWQNRGRLPHAVPGGAPMLSRRMPIKGSHTRSWPRTKRPLAGPSGSAMERRRAAGRQQGVQPGEVASSYSSPQAVGPCPSLPHTAARGTGTQNHLEQRGPGVASRALIPPGAQLAPIDHWRRGPIPPLLWAPSRQLCFRPGFHEGGSVHVWLSLGLGASAVFCTPRSTGPPFLGLLSPLSQLTLGNSLLHTQGQAALAHGLSQTD